MRTILKTYNDYMVEAILNNKIQLGFCEKGISTTKEFKPYQDKNIPIILNIYNRIFDNFVEGDDTDIEQIRKYLKKTNLKLKKRNKQYFIINK